MNVVKAVLALSVAVNVWLAYLLLDAGVTSTHQASALVTTERSAAACLDVLRLDWMRRSEAEVVALPDRLKAAGVSAEGVYLTRDGDVLAVLDLAFRVRSGKVVELDYYADLRLTPKSEGPTR